MPIHALPKGLTEKTINGVLDTVETPENLYFSRKFKSRASASTFLRWVVLTGGGGMAPVTALGVPAPVYQGGGAYEITARPAMIQEKMFTTAEEINDLMEAVPEVRAALEGAKWDDVEELARRQFYRREWMAAQVAFNGGVMEYNDDQGRRFSIDHFVPATHKVQLASEFKWKTGATRDPIKDLTEMYERIGKYAAGVKIFVNTNTKNNKIKGDPALLQLFKSSEYGEKAVKAFIANPLVALSQLLEIPISVYDETYPEEARIVSKTSDTVWGFDSVRYLEAGMKVTFVRVENEQQYEEWEATVASVSGNQVTFADPVTVNFVPGRDKILVAVPFLKDNRVAFVGETLKTGKPIAEWRDCFYGLPRRIGMKSYSEATKDPDAIKTVLQRYGLWTFYSSKALGYLDV